MARRLKIWCGVFAILLLLIVATILVLYFTILKPKQPIMTTQPIMLESIEVSPLGINVKVGIDITVYNRNYGSFRCESSTAYISYRGTGVAGAPTQRDYIPARARHSISTSVTVFANELVKVPGFGIDLLSGVVKFTSSTTLHGYVKVLKILKAKAEAESTCDVSIFWVKRTSESVCKSQTKGGH